MREIWDLLASRIVDENEKAAFRAWKRRCMEVLLEYWAENMTALTRAAVLEWWEKARLPEDVVAVEKPKPDAPQDATDAVQGMLALTGGSKRKAPKQDTDRLRLLELELAWKSAWLRHYQEEPAPWRYPERKAIRDTLQSFQGSTSDLRMVIMLGVEIWEERRSRRPDLPPRPPLQYVLAMRDDLAAQARVLSAYRLLEARMSTHRQCNPGVSFSEELEREWRELRSEMVSVGLSRYVEGSIWEEAEGDGWI